VTQGQPGRGYGTARAPARELEDARRKRYRLPRLLVDLTRLPVGVLAAAATLVAAIVAGCTVTLATWINVRAARKLAHETARRDFRLTIMRPCFDYLDRRIVQYREAIEMGPAVVAGIEKAIPLAPDERAKEVTALGQRVQEFATRLAQSKGINQSPALLAVVVSNRRVVDAFSEWLTKDRAFFEALVAAGGVTAVPEALTELRQRASDAFKMAVTFRIIAEDALFGRYSWLRRLSDLVISKSRRALCKLKVNRNGKQAAAAET
jgi:hypothetical protein